MKLNTGDRICPLCGAAEAKDFYRDETRDYFRCRRCNLVFVPSRQFLSPEDEKARYDLHRNLPDDKNYRRFLGRLFIPMRDILTPGAKGLDFGSGPGPTLSLMFEQAGHPMSVYDCFYSPDQSVLKKQYDFITATEVAEHLHRPGEELSRLWRCLRPGGKLGIMTKFTPGPDEFASSHYRKDLTHVSFFSKATFEWLAARWPAKILFCENDVIIFSKED
ncbi:MAG: class I SAM-dependent methyltransferase [Candidatus Krumholzibacteriota bacterium]|nr:class I SAM-dependent methyltransferase [Candidatus Krumholzibacteriota bacterium]